MVQFGSKLWRCPLEQLKRLVLLPIGHPFIAKVGALYSSADLGRHNSAELEEVGLLQDWRRGLGSDAKRGRGSNRSSRARVSIRQMAAATARTEGRAAVALVAEYGWDESLYDALRDHPTSRTSVGCRSTGLAEPSCDRHKCCAIRCPIASTVVYMLGSSLTRLLSSLHGEF